MQVCSKVPGIICSEHRGYGTSEEKNKELGSAANSWSFALTRIGLI